jgi:hypothetical protein
VAGARVVSLPVLSQADDTAALNPRSPQKAIHAVTPMARSAHAYLELERANLPSGVGGGCRREEDMKYRMDIFKTGP